MDTPQNNEGPPTSLPDFSKEEIQTEASHEPEKVESPAVDKDISLSVDLNDDGTVHGTEPPDIEPKEQLHIEEAQPAAAAATEQPKYPEEGWRAWAAVYALFAAQCFALGVPQSWGLYQRSLLLENTFPGANNFQLSFVGTVTIGVLPTFGIVTGALADYYPTRFLYLFGSIGMSVALVCDSLANELWQLYCSRALFGICAAFCVMPGTASLPTWWTKRRALAMGIALSGTGVGGFLLNAVSQACISAGGWRLGLRVCAAMCFGMMVPAAWFMERRIRPDKAKRRKAPLFNFTVFRNKTFSLLFFISFIFIFGFFSFSIYVPLMMTDGGYSNAAGAAIVATYSAIMAVGRILGGFITPRVGEINM